MPNVGVLILVSVLGAWMCVKARAAGPAAAFSVLALVLFVSTPVGAGLPGALGSLFSAVDSATTPALNHDAGTPVSTTSVGVRR